MTDPTREPEREPIDDATPMPRWVPVAIGVVLVTLAALAVVTGLRYRDQTLVRIVQPKPRRHARHRAGSAGRAGAGRVAHVSRRRANNVPPRTRADPRLVARGDHRRSRRCRGSAEIVGAPRNAHERHAADAVVYVNDVAIGQANQFDSEDEEYDFAAPGSYTIRLVAPGYKERVFIVTAADNAKGEVAKDRREAGEAGSGAEANNGQAGCDAA